MTQQQLDHRFQIAMSFHQKLITSKEASQALNLGERQFFRLVEKLSSRNWDKSCLQYQSHAAWNKTDDNVENKILNLAQNYPDALNSHLQWLLYDSESLDMKSFTIKSILVRHNQYIPFKEKKHRGYKKFQATHFGALAQLDTSDGYWLKGYPMIHLILAIDDASRTILNAHFYLHDSTINNMGVIKGIILKYGVPALFYTDCDSKFKVIRHGLSHYQRYGREVLAGEAITEIRRALSEVGSGLITAKPYHPQSKGKVEKVFRFIQDCFLAHHTAANLDELNSQFQRWLLWYDQRNHRTLGTAPAMVRKKLIRQKLVAFKQLPKNLDLDNIFAVSEIRKPNKYNIFSYNGKQYQLPLEKVVYPGQVELRILPDNSINVFQENKLITTLAN